MHDLDDMALLREYVERDSEAAFATLVTRHIDKVYSVALRHTGNAHQAEEITQAVFVILAKKSPHLRQPVILAGWLYQTARLTALTQVRSEIRRVRREQEAYMQTGLNENDSTVWSQITPLLDAALAGLNEADRNAVVLRFFYDKSMREIGDATGATEDTARMRVNRAMEKLRKFFLKRGVTSTTAGIASALSANSVQAAPAVLAKSITAIAVTKGATACGSTLILIKGALKLMAWSKTQTSIVVGVAVLLAAGTATVVVKKITAEGPEAWQEKYDLSGLKRMKPEVKMLPSLPSTLKSGLQVWGDNDGRALGLGQSVVNLLTIAYGVQPAQLILQAPVPAGKYDFIATYPKLEDNFKAGQEEIRKRFGLTGQRVNIETNVLVLTVISRNAPGLRHSTSDNFSGNLLPNSFSTHGQSIYAFIYYLEQNLGMVVIDQTGLGGNLDIDFKWDKTPEGLKQVVSDELGLNLTVTNQPVDFVIVEKVK